MVGHDLGAGDQLDGVADLDDYLFLVIESLSVRDDQCEAMVCFLVKDTGITAGQLVAVTFHDRVRYTTVSQVPVNERQRVRVVMQVTDIPGQFHCVAAVHFKEIYVKTNHRLEVPLWNLLNVC